MTEFLIRADRVSLQVPVFQPGDRKIMTNPLRFISDLYFGRTRRGIATLLDDISLELKPGDRLGIIGTNGAGKSTLLRLLAGIYSPTTGRLEQRGLVKGLFDISLGMNPEATGLENIYMRGLQMGLALSEVREMVPGVLAFSELEHAIEKPLNTYSTGMRLRLAVSVSTMITPDVLLLDEWIGTGDAHFRDKLRNRMNTLVEDARSLVIATHNTQLMKSLCNRGLVLESGRIVFQGEIDEALGWYAEQTEAEKSAGSRSALTNVGQQAPEQ